MGQQRRPSNAWLPSHRSAYCVWFRLNLHVDEYNKYYHSAKYNSFIAPGFLSELIEPWTFIRLLFFLHKAGIYRETIDDIPFPKIPAQPIHQREAEILLR